MIEGVRDYQQRHLPKESTPSRVIWRKANARLLDYGGAPDAPALLCVPSLINRASIFDLHAKRSFVRFMRDAGVRVLILDWDTPGPRERRYGMSEYVDYLLLEALDSLRLQHRGALYLLGYCMGGLLAIAGAQLRPESLDGLLLLATPFERVVAPELKEEQWQAFEDFIRQQNALHPAITQTLFHLLDPWHFQNKFTRYSELNEADKIHFAYVEQWANDGIPLSRYVARECYIKWPKHNYFAQGNWRVRGQAIRPELISCPTLCVLPREDKIVPLLSSEPLAKRIPDISTLSPQSGHISMLVGRWAKAELWQPLLEWIET